MDEEVHIKTAQGLKKVRRTCLELPEGRDQALHTLQRVLGENTTSKTIDIALTICLNLYENSDNLARAQLVKIVPEKHLSKFLLKSNTTGVT